MAFPACDVDVLGNGALIMRTMQPGNTDEASPTKGEVAEIEVVKMLVADHEHPFFPTLRSFRVGDGDECDALELIAQRMHPSEVCAVRSVPAGFGLEQSLCKVQPPPEVKAVFRLVRVQRPPPVIECPLADRVAEAKKKKQRGNTLFEREEFQAAAYSFGLGISYIAETCHKYAARQRVGEESEEDVPEDVLQLCTSLYTNIALVQLKLPDGLKGTVQACDGALHLQPENAKAMYLKAKALLAEKPVSPGDLRTAIFLLEACLRIEPKSKNAQELLDTARQTEVPGSQSAQILYLLAVSLIFIAILPSLVRMIVSDFNVYATWGGLLTGRPSQPPALVDTSMRDDDVGLSL